MVIDEVEGVSHVVINVADYINEEDKELQNTELYVVPCALKALHHFDGFFFKSSSSYLTTQGKLNLET